jgi:FkbM family methyltransferase
MLIGLAPSFVRQLIYHLPVANILRQWLNRVTIEGYTWVTVAAGLAQGIHMLIDLSCEKYYYLGTYEQDLQSVLPKILLPGHTVYDVGAHAGFFSLALARIVGSKGRVYAFEPLPENYDRIQAATKKNNLPQIIVIQSAVANRVGMTSLYIASNTSIGSLLKQGDSSLEVNMMSLDSFIYDEGNPPPDLIKIDIEGAESLALEGMNYLAKESSPTILIEIHEGQAEFVLFWMAEHGYSIYHLNGDLSTPVKLSKSETGHYLAKPQL